MVRPRFLCLSVSPKHIVPYWTHEMVVEADREVHVGSWNSETNP